MLKKILLTALAALMVAGLAPAAGAQFDQPTNYTNFTGAYYKPLDVARAARDQYGSSATVELPCQHLYCWKARLNGRLYGIDMRKAVSSQYGTSYRLVATGVHAYDWKAFRPSDPQNWVLPVMIVASDQWFDIQGVRDALTRYRSVLSTTRNWYYARAGETYRHLQPVVMYSSGNSQWWNDTSVLTTNDAYRSALFDAGLVVYKANLPLPGSNLRVALSIHAANAVDVWWGAMAGSGVAVIPQRATSITCAATGYQDPNCANATYAAGHELGHTFGLNHTCDDYGRDDNCWYSIMQNGYPWDAILLAGEVTDLRASAFFS